MRNANDYMMYDIIVFKNLRFRHASTRKFSKNLHSRPFSKTCVFVARKGRLRVDGKLKRRKEISVFKISGYMWTLARASNNIYDTN